MLEPILPKPIIPSCIEFPLSRRQRPGKLAPLRVGAIFTVGMAPTVLRGPMEWITKEFVNRFTKVSSQTVQSKGWFSFAIPGGSVAETFLPNLVSADVNWDRVQIFYTDERAVPPSDPQSNYHLSREMLLNHVPINPTRIHRMEAEGADPRSAAQAYEGLITDILGIPPKLDLVLMGVGTDGHVCSLFPDDPALKMGEWWVAGVTRSPKPPSKRMTLTLKTLAAARKIFIAGFGSEKGDLVRRILDDPSSPLPLSRVIGLAGDVTIFLGES